MSVLAENHVQTATHHSHDVYPCEYLKVTGCTVFVGYKVYRRHKNALTHSNLQSNPSSFHLTQKMIFKSHTSDGEDSACVTFRFKAWSSLSSHHWVIPNKHSQYVKPKSVSMTKHLWWVCNFFCYMPEVLGSIFNTFRKQCSLFVCVWLTLRWMRHPRLTMLYVTPSKELEDVGVTSSGAATELWMNSVTCSS